MEASNNFAPPDAGGRAEQLRQITGSVDIGAGFGAKVVRVFSGKVPDKGAVDVRGLLAQLQSSAYKGLVTVEFEGDGEQQSGTIHSDTAD